MATASATKTRLILIAATVATAVALAAAPLPAIAPAYAADGEDGNPISLGSDATYRGFTDVVGHWVVDEGWLDYVLDNGLMTGYNPATFAPENNVTRAQVATVLFRHANPDSSATSAAASYENDTTGFSDVPKKDYFSAALNWAKKQGIFTGDSGKTTVRPYDSITREELALVLYRYAKANGASASGAAASSYRSAPDAASVSPWASEGVGWCFARRVMTGNATDGTLEPQGSANRAATAKMITVVVRDTL